MTVEELINKLSKLEQDKRIYFSAPCCCGNVEAEVDEIEIETEFTRKYYPSSYVTIPKKYVNTGVDSYCIVI